MPYFIRFSVLILLSVTSAFALDEEFMANEKDLPLPSQRIQTLQGGINLYYFDYAESVAPPLKSTESGVLPGVNLSYQTQNLERTWVLRAGLDLTEFSTQYDGSTQGPSVRPVQQKTSNTFVNVVLLGGYRLGNVPALGSVTAHAGLGRHMWRRGDNGVQAGVQFMQENYAWFYAPVGVLLERSLSEKFSLGLDTSVHFMFGGSMQLMLSKSYSGVNDPSVNLGSKVGYRIELPMQYKVSGDLVAHFSPWYQFSAIGESDRNTLTIDGNPAMRFYEPASRTYQYGTSFAVSTSW
jgi:hypothetical protein